MPTNAQCKDVNKVTTENQHHTCILNANYHLKVDSESSKFIFRVKTYFSYIASFANID